MSHIHLILAIQVFWSFSQEIDQKKTHFGHKRGYLWKKLGRTLFLKQVWNGSYSVENILHFY